MARKILVIGAGPSGVQAAHQLLIRGLEVEMIDFGVTSSRHEQPLEPLTTFLSVRTHAQEQSHLWWGENYSDFSFHTGRRES